MYERGAPKATAATNNRWRSKMVLERKATVGWTEVANMPAKSFSDSAKATVHAERLLTMQWMRRHRSVEHVAVDVRQAQRCARRETQPD